MACDEIFSHFRPILITVDPVSSAILRIELADSREVSVWKEHWECIERSGYLAVYLVNDEGKSKSLAQKKVLSQVIRQSDTFHGLAHRLGAWVDRLEKTAYTAIEREEDRLNRLQGDPLDAETYIDESVLVFVLIGDALKMFLEQKLDRIDPARLVDRLLDGGESRG